MESGNHNREIGETVRRCLLSIMVGEPVRCGNLSVFPLFFDQKPRVDYKVLEEALQDRLVEITEVSEGGSVPELLFVNRSDKCVLLVDGEELVGAKQNRILNITVLAPPKTNLLIPVSCVEQGRWHYSSHGFAAGSHASMKIRSSSKAFVQESIRHRKSFTSNQAHVWNEVDNLMADLDVSSGSHAMHESYHQYDESIKETVEKMDLPEGANGYIACVGDMILGGDIFDKAETLQKKWNRLIQGAIIESLRIRNQHKNQVEKSSVVNFLKTAAESTADIFTPPGMGIGLNITGKSVVGSILVEDESIVHASIFQRIV